MFPLIYANLCAFAAMAAEPGHAATTTGTIFLRGVVPERAIIGISSPIVSKGTGAAVVPGAPSRMAFELSPVSTKLSAAVFHLDRLANSSSGFVVSLSAGSASDGAPVMTGEDGAALPYRVRFGGRDVTFADGAAELATVTRDTRDDETSGLFEILAPALPAVGKGLSDHIVLIVAAR